MEWRKGEEEGGIAIYMLNVERHDVGSESESERERNSIRQSAFAARSCDCMSLTALLEYSEDVGWSVAAQKMEKTTTQHPPSRPGWNSGRRMKDDGLF